MNPAIPRHVPALIALAVASAPMPVRGQAEAVPARSTCTQAGPHRSYCGLPNPEDLEVLPGGRGVLASDMRIRAGERGIASGQGVLKWLDPATGSVTPLYPAAGTRAGRGDWGSPDCPGEIGADLLPHGIHLTRRRGGAWQVLAVNHGGRESVEFFELARRGGAWTLRWRGCAVPPGPNRLNDVVGLSDGGFLVTTMHREAHQSADLMQRAAHGENTGLLWRWTPRTGFSEQAGSASPRPNGVQIDAPGRYAYISAATGGGEVRKVDLSGRDPVARVAVPKPDNASWSRDGRLLVTGMRPEANGMACFATPQAACPAAFEVYAIDPATMRAERLFAHEGPPVGGGTVAVQYGDDLLVGSFAGDRVMAVQGLFAKGAVGRSPEGETRR